jgi:5-methylcytosine-specific restriction endonuclease McrA
MSAIDEKTLVLNRSRVPVHIKSVKDALCDVMAEVAVFIDYDFTKDGQPELWTSEDGKTSNLNPTFSQGFTFPEWINLTEEQIFEIDCGDRAPIPLIKARHPVKVPYVIQLTEYNEVPEMDIRLTRKNLMLRDANSCQYCGAKLKNNEATLDHVYPKSRQGDMSWTNIVISCFPCNVRKRNRTPEEAGMPLRSKPSKPKWYPLSTRFGETAPDCWKHFIKDFDQIKQNARA